MANSEHARDGQVWCYNHNVLYRITKIRPAIGKLAIGKVEQRGDTYVDASGSNTDYSFADFNTSKWELVSDVLKNCPECDMEKVIPGDDFICADCRATTPVTCRLVADVDGEPSIVVMTGTDKYMEFEEASTGKALLRLRREDLPQASMVVLKKFT